eukprot:COSAG02_NODE_3789_length_6229_cov_3.678630_8_plen_82_part_00
MNHRVSASLDPSLTHDTDSLMNAEGPRRNMQILNWEMNSARILCAQIQFGLETHPAMYRDARTNENSNYPHFDLERAHIQK